MHDTLFKAMETPEAFPLIQALDHIHKVDPQALLDQSLHGLDKTIGKVVAFVLRDSAVERYGFTLPRPDFWKHIQHFGPLLEVGAGSGALSRSLTNKGFDVIATDLEPRGPDVLTMDAANAIRMHPARTVLMSWPDLDEDWPEQALRAMTKGQHLVLCSEDRGGACANDAFFDVLAEHFQFVESWHKAVTAWPGLHDKASVWLRKT